MSSPDGQEKAGNDSGVETVLVPLSGGGLVAGIAAAVKGLRPDVRVIAISMRRGAAMQASLAAGHPVEVEELPTFADSLGGGIGLGNAWTFPLAAIASTGGKICRTEEKNIHPFDGAHSGHIQCSIHTFYQWHNQHMFVRSLGMLNKALSPDSGTFTTYTATPLRWIANVQDRCFDVFDGFDPGNDNPVCANVEHTFCERCAAFGQSD